MFGSPLKSSSNTDTDSDGLNDWDEVDITSSLIQWNEDGTIVLPTLLECYNYKGEQKPYVSEGFCKYMLSHDSNPISYLRNLQIMPILSDPTSEDSDGDGFLDNLNNNFERIYEIKDPNMLKKEIVWEWPAIDKDTGEKIPYLQSSFYEKRWSDTYQAFYAHKGIDISTGGVKGDTVVASYDGKVIYSSKESGIWCNDCNGPNTPCNCNGNAGNYIVIEHNINGTLYYSRYLHLSAINVSSGDYVYFNQKIGEVGSTGSSSGYHLHYDISINSIKNYVDPILFQNAYTTNLVVPKKPSQFMIINIPKSLQNTCSTPSDGCNEYICKINEMYNINQEV